MKKSKKRNTVRVVTRLMRTSKVRRDIARSLSGRRLYNIRHMATHFFKMESSAGIVMIIAAIAALIVANSPLYALYDYFFHGISLHIGAAGADEVVHGHGHGHGAHDLIFDYAINQSVLHWVNDGLMAIFFFLVGLEIKREFVEGELSSRAKASLPFIAAIGGMVVPALVYVAININHPENLPGWAIPAATDIAFALCALSLAGSRAPIQLKILLTAIAVIDDLGAILIIAFFYTSELNILPLYLAGAILAVMFMMTRFRVSSASPFIVLGAVLWVAVLQSGVHATLAGVATAFFIPMKSRHDPNVSPAKNLEHSLHYWVAFGILPFFAFANAGVPFAGMGLHSLMEPVTLGIVLGLVVGKPLGIFSMLVLAIKSGICSMPANTTWTQLLAVSMLAGIGFTMSLFIGTLAFETLEFQASIRLGVLAGSTISAIAGYMMLVYGPRTSVQNSANTLQSTLA